MPLSYKSIVRPPRSGQRKAWMVAVMLLDLYCVYLAGRSWHRFHSWDGTNWSVFYSKGDLYFVFRSGEDATFPKASQFSRFDILFFCYLRGEMPSGSVIWQLLIPLWALSALLILVNYVVVRPPRGPAVEHQTPGQMDNGPPMDDEGTQSP